VYRRFTSPGWIAGHLLVLAAVLTCLRLGWWQWDRSNEASGDAQNLGYALLWPAFGAAFVYMWFRFLRLETLKEAEDRAAADRAGSELNDELAELLDSAESADGRAAEPDAHGRAAQNVGDGRTESPIGIEPQPRDPQPRDEPPRDQPVPADPRQRPFNGVTVAVATVGENDDDPELTEYNRALAALAEEDRRRGR
jgi:hypothetical protein